MTFKGNYVEESEVVKLTPVFHTCFRQIELCPIPESFDDSIFEKLLDEITDDKEYLQLFTMA